MPGVFHIMYAAIETAIVADNVAALSAPVFVPQGEKYCVFRDGDVINSSERASATIASAALSSDERNDTPIFAPKALSSICEALHYTLKKCRIIGFGCRLGRKVVLRYLALNQRLSAVRSALKHINNHTVTS